MVVFAWFGVAGQNRPNAGGSKEGDAVFRIDFEGGFLVFERLPGLQNGHTALAIALEDDHWVYHLDRDPDEDKKSRDEIAKMLREAGARE